MAGFSQIGHLLELLKEPWGLAALAALVVAAGALIFVLVRRRHKRR